jgi:hypothetical protein
MSIAFHFFHFYREAYVLLENQYDDAMNTHFLNKRPTDFWKAWHSKFAQKIITTVRSPVVLLM